MNLARQSQDSHMPCCWRGGARASSGTTARQMVKLEALEEERKKSRAVGGALCKSRKTVVRTLRVSLRHDTTCDQAELRLHEFRKISNAAGAGRRFIYTL